MWWTAEEEGDMELVVGLSVVGDTMVGGVDDSYPELAAGEGCEPCEEDSWTKENRGRGLGRGRLLSRPESRKVHFPKFACPLGGQQIRRAELRIASSSLSPGFRERWPRLLQQHPQSQLWQHGLEATPLIFTFIMKNSV